MKKQHVLFSLLLFCCAIGFAQNKNMRIGYVDMEYILEKTPEYKNSLTLLEEKANSWRLEIENKKNALSAYKEKYLAEKVILTKELIEDREAEIATQEKNIIEYQDKRFGPNGDLFIQRANLIKPIQDQVFNVIQDLASTKAYDFIFDKSSDLSILFANKRYDISELVLKNLNKTKTSTKNPTKDANKPLISKVEDTATIEVDEETEKSPRELAIEKRKADAEAARLARVKAFEDRKAAALAKKNEAAAAKQKKNETPMQQNIVTPSSNNVAPNAIVKDTVATLSPVEKRRLEVEALRKKAADARAKKIEERQKAIDEKKKQLQAKKDAAETTKKN